MNSKIIRCLERLIKYVKKDDSYRFNTSYSLKQLMYSVFYRSIQFVRGYKLILKCKECRLPIFCGKSVRVEHGYMLSCGSGLILEDYAYINALSELGIQIGQNVTIARGASLVCTGVIANKGKGIIIGNNCAVGAQSFLAGQGGIKIGNDVIIGPGVRIFSENHNYNEIEISIRKQGETRKGIIIEDNCWIGANAVILDGIRIGKGTVIAAGSVVTNSIDQNKVAAGVPAKVIKIRH